MLREKAQLSGPVAHKAILEYMQVDAFTDQPLAGNPCVVVFDAGSLNEQTMLAIARETNLSETAFVVPSLITQFGARYFTPAEEIPLAGHPTLATIFAMVASGRLTLDPDSPQTTVNLELRAGVIKVEITSDQGVIQRITMSQQKPQFLAKYDPAEIMPIFGLSPLDVLPNAPIQTVSTGTPQLMIPVRDLVALRRARLNHAAYVELRNQSDFFSPHLFVLEGITPAGRTFARHFGTPPDTMEDPFTGSATGGMAAYLWRYEFIDEPTFIAEQGHWLNRPGQAFVEVVGSPANIETVKVGGAAVAVARGELML